jgi:hypothetical protein
MKGIKLPDDLIQRIIAAKAAGAAAKGVGRATESGGVVFPQIRDDNPGPDSRSLDPGHRHFIDHELHGPAGTPGYAFRINASQFGIYDTFPHEEGRQAHLAGKVATALGARVDELLASAPSIQPVEVLAFT